MALLQSEMELSGDYSRDVHPDLTVAEAWDAEVDSWSDQFQVRVTDAEMEQLRLAFVSGWNRLDAYWQAHLAANYQEREAV